MEHWKPIRDLPYEVSGLGRVRRIGGQMLKPILKKATGYQYVTLYEQGRPHQLRLHRVVMEAFRGICPPEHEVHHVNGDRADNRLHNLRYVTRKQHHVVEPRALPGQANGNARLSLDQVITIRARHANGESVASIARDFPVTYWAISRIVHRKTWRHITPRSA